MNRWLLRAPLWALATVCGIPIAVFLAASFVLVLRAPAMLERRAERLRGADR